MNSNDWKVALAQINPVVGDLEGNARLIVAAARLAQAQGAHLLLTPELSLCGYPPEDLLFRPAFLKRCEMALDALALALAEFEGLKVVVGHPHGVSGGALDRASSDSGPICFNAASVLYRGRVTGRYFKRDLPNYRVFDERRYFLSGREEGFGPLVVDVEGVRVGVLLCEDAWMEEPARLAKSAGAQLLCVLNASPFHVGKVAEREAQMAARAKDVGLPLVYAHQVGGQDEVVFDGASFAVSASAGITARAPSFQELVAVWTLTRGGVVGPISVPPELDQQIWSALVTGVRDYVGKNGFPGVLLGLSGGIDSALVLAVAVEALGPKRVRAVMMPSPYTAPMSWEDSRSMVSRLGVPYDEINISPMMSSFESALREHFVGRPLDATEENIQARIRGTLLMALSNKTGWLVVTTGNKSEMATGYCTLYGDMAGGFAVIKDLSKTWVYRLARWVNQHGLLVDGAKLENAIPHRIIDRPPSAELRPDQTDQDSLPPYDVLDGILERYMEQDHAIEDIVAAGYDRADVDKVTKLIKLNEYKRRQAPLGIRITSRAFGRDWRYPITSRFLA